MFDSGEVAACQRLVRWALEEDLGAVGDLTSQALIPEQASGCAVFVARAPGVLAGVPAAAEVLAAVESRLRFEPLATDGQRVEAGQQLARLTGPMRGILTAERTALNFLQYLSGIATLTRRYVEAVAGLPVRILDTRKTLPGWRSLAKYAVRCGGGQNHRMGLHDGILIKDNHLAALPVADCGSQIEAAVRQARSLQSAIRNPQSAIEIEVDTLEQLAQALSCKPDIVLLDNMTPDQLGEAVRRRNASAADVLLEASGGVTLATVRAIAETGVDRISVGALTHSAPALDIALDYVQP
jgi:nicotinate-nucleotide pyrophosphorylase (carboxylating)